MRVVSLYAEAPDYRPTGSPERDGFEGIASLDDAARAVVVYLREYESTGDTSARNEAVRGDHVHMVANPAKGEPVGERGLPNRGYRPGQKTARRQEKSRKGKGGGLGPRA